MSTIASINVPVPTAPTGMDPAEACLAAWLAEAIRSKCTYQVLSELQVPDETHDCAAVMDEHYRHYVVQARDGRVSARLLADRERVILSERHGLGGWWTR